MTASWAPGADGSGFDLDHLPYGVVDPGDGPRPAVAVGDVAVDLRRLADAGLLADVDRDPLAWADADRLNPLLDAGPDVWARLRRRLTELLRRDADARPPDGALLDRAATRLVRPFEVADFVDFYSSLEHATNVGRMFRPDDEPLLPNWRWLPVGYHGRAGTVVVSGTPIVRPAGQRPPTADGDGPTFGPTRRLDFELELAVVTGADPPRTRVPVDRAEELVFGAVLCNDWSARDLQAWEYRPLGPFLGKSFATSVGGWITPWAALRHARVPGRAQDPTPLGYLRAPEPRALDIDLEVAVSSASMRRRGVAPVVVSRTNASGLYWSVAQQLAHASVNGATIRSGDLFASGTISGPRRGAEGSLLELTRNGRDPLDLAGERREFLEDGDEVVLRGRARGAGDASIRLAEVRARIDPVAAAKPPAGTV